MLPISSFGPHPVNSIGLDFTLLKGEKTRNPPAALSGWEDIRVTVTGTMMIRRYRQAELERLPEKSGTLHPRRPAGGALPCGG